MHGMSVRNDDGDDDTQRKRPRLNVGYIVEHGMEAVGDQDESEHERGGWDGDERGRRPSARPWAARNGKMEVSTRASLRRTIKPAPRTNSGDYLILLLFRPGLLAVLALLRAGDGL